MVTTAATKRHLSVHDRDQAQARELILAVGEDGFSLAVTDAEREQVAVPAELASILHAVLAAVADGACISIDRLPEELTPAAAAEVLGVSRPAVMKMVQRGELSAHKVGTHHRIRAADVFDLKRVRRQRQREAFARLRELDEQLEEY